MDTWTSIGLTIVLGAIKDSVKNPKKKEEMRKALLKVRDQINALYPEDTDAQS